MRRAPVGLLGLAMLAGVCLGWRGEWLDFPPYPAARDLCSGRVYGNSGGKRTEIQWWSFASADPTARVMDFYSKASKQVERDKGSLTVRHGQDSVLSVHPASASGYPSCDSKPTPGEKTVIVVSRTIR